MNNIQGYERVIPHKSKKRKAVGICVYSAFGIAAVISVLITMNIYILALSFFAELILILLTKKFLSYELEYSFFGGVFTASRIYGKTHRSVAFEAELSKCIYIAHATPENLARAASMANDSPCDLSVAEAEGDRIIIVTEEDKEREQVVINADKRTLEILYKSNPSACTLEIRVMAR